MDSRGYILALLVWLGIWMRGVGCMRIKSFTSIDYKVIEDDGTVRTWHEEYRVPLSTPAPTYSGLLKSYIQPGRRARALDRPKPRKEHCVKHPGRGEVFHEALIVNVEESASLPCHFCGDSVEKTKAAHTWYRYNHQRFNHTMEWMANEVDLDMHDDDNKNRVFLEPDHTLVIRNTTILDIGSYFCMMYNESRNMDRKFVFDAGSLNAISAATLAMVWEPDDTDVDFLYFLDVSVVLDAQLVSRGGGDMYPHPEPFLHQDAEGNWEAVTEWGTWSKCSACDQEAERRRKGSCMVRMIENHKLVQDEYINNVLHLYPDGVACHSSIFLHKAKLISSLPQQVEVEECFVHCSHEPGLETEHVMRRGLGFGLYKKPKVRGPSKFFRQKIHKFEGAQVRIACINSHRRSTPVSWFNGTATVTSLAFAAKTNKRIEIDADGVFFIHEAKLGDAGLFSCSYDGKTQAEYNVKITASVYIENPGPYLTLLYLAYAADFLIFLIIMSIRHWLHKRSTISQPNIEEGEKIDVTKPLISDSTSDSSSSGAFSPVMMPAMYAGYGAVVPPVYQAQPGYSDSSSSISGSGGDSSSSASSDSD